MGFPKDVAKVTQESQLVVVHHEFDAVNLQGLRILSGRVKKLKFKYILTHLALKDKKKHWRWLPGIPHPADERQGLAGLLVAEQRDALHQVGGQDEVLDAEHLMDVELRVDEGHARQVVVLQHPEEDLRERKDSTPVNVLRMNVSLP